MHDRPPSRRLVLRLPASLHEQVSLAAVREGVSTNQFVAAVLAGAVRWQSQIASAPRRSPADAKGEDDRIWEMWAEIFR
jgi:hypothetical protein